MLRNDLKNSISKIFDDKYYKIWHLGNQLVISYILKLFKEMNVYAVLLRQPLSISNIIDNCKFHKQAFIPLEWIMKFLISQGVISEAGNIPSFYRLVDEYACEIPEKIEKTMLTIDPTLFSFCELTKVAFQEYPNFFRGKKGVEILFSSDRLKLWDQYFSNNVGYKAYNKLASETACYWLSTCNCQRILELGAGSGSATICLLRDLAKVRFTERISKYIFTDTSPLLLKIGREKLKENLLIENASFVTQRLNFNISFRTQNILPGSIDIVYAVNAAHVADDILFTLKEIFDSLKVKGSVILTECIRSKTAPYPFQEVVFNMLESYTNVVLNAHYRPVHGFLSIQNWIDLFNVVGFEEIEVFCNVDRENCKSMQKPKIAMVIRGQKSEK